MMINGEPLLSPDCPAQRSGERVALPTNNVVLAVDSCDDDVTGNPTNTETFFYFRKTDDQDTMIGALDTGVIITPVEDEFSDKAYHADLGGREVAVRIGALLCDRIANCPGPVNGECWALGATALREVIEQVVDSPQP